MAKKIQVEIVGDASSLSKAFKQSEGDASSFGSKVATASKLAVGAFAAIGAGSVVAAVASTKAWDSYSDTLQQMVGLAGVSQKQVNAWGNELLTLGPKVAKSPQELAEALYQVASSGAPVSKAMDILTVSAKASSAGLGETAQVADAVTSVMNAYGASNESASDAVNTLIATVREGKGEAADFAPVIGNVTALAAQMGVSFNDVGAALASETRLGTDAATAATQLQAIFSGLLKTTTPAAKALAAVGLSSAGLRQELKDKGLLATVQSISTAFDGNTSAMAKAFPNIRALRGLLSLTGKDGKSVAEVFNSMKDNTGALDKAFDASAKGGAFKWDDLMAGLHADSIAFGDLISPLVTKLEGLAANGLGAVQQAITKINSASGLKAKLDVGWDITESAATSLYDSLRTMIVGVNAPKIMLDTGKVIGFEHTEGLAQQFASSIQGVDWSGVGETIGKGITDAIQKAVNGAHAVDWNKFGREMGPGLAAAAASAIATALDPSFWLKNWDLALAIGLSAFGDGIGRIAGKFAAPLVRMGGDAVLAMIAPIERFMPRVADELLTAFLHDTASLGGILESLASLVERQFSRLGGISRFAIKVIGIDAAINAIVNFATKVGQELGKLAAEAYAYAVSIGGEIVHGILDGIKSLPGELASKLGGFLSSAVHAAGSKLHGSGEFMWTKQAIGEQMTAGIIAGISGTDTKVAAQLVNSLGAALRAGQSEVNKLQAQINADQQSETVRQNAKALADAEAAVAVAVKKGKGVADAEQGLLQAQQAIRDNAAQVELTRQQANLDHIQTAYDAAQKKLQTAQDKAQAVLQAAQDKAGAAYDTLSDRIKTAFSAAQDAFVAPAQKQLDAIQAATDAQDRQNAVIDAGNSLKDAQAQLATMQADTSGDTTAQQIAEQQQTVVEAQQALNAAQNAALIVGLQQQAAIQTTNHTNMANAEQNALDASLTALQKNLTSGKLSVGDAMADITKLLKKYDIDFANVGAELGNAFGDQLLGAIKAAAQAAAKIQVGGKSIAVNTSTAIVGDVPKYGGSFAAGGTVPGPIGAPIMIQAHGGETVTPVGGGSGGATVSITVNGFVGNPAELTQQIKTLLTRDALDGGSAPPWQR